MSKNVLETEGPQTSQYGAYALRAGLARLWARVHMNTPTRPGTHMHARTRKHAHTGKYVLLTAFPHQQWFRERSSMLRYTYIACVIIFCLQNNFASVGYDKLLFPKGQAARSSGKITEHKTCVFIFSTTSCTR